MVGTSVSFDGNSLQTANIITSAIQHGGTPTKNLNRLPLAHANLSKIPVVYYPSKDIKVIGKVVDTSVAALDATLDTFRGYFSGIEKNLDIDYNGSTRRYVATLAALTIDRPGGLLFANFELDFAASNPFGKDTTNTTALNVIGRTTASSTDNYAFLGTAPTQWPVITITLSALTGGTNATVVVGNSGTGQQISVTRTWSAGDVLVVDVANRTVTVNGTAVAFSGAFPEFAPGTQTFSYSDTLTTRTFTYNIVYAPMYL